MKTTLFTLAVAALATLTAAAPSLPNPAKHLKARTDYVNVVFEGATPEAQVSRSFAVDGSVQYIGDPLSISHINVQGAASCTFYGVDGSVTSLTGPTTVDVGPPQTQIYGICE